MKKFLFTYWLSIAGFFALFYWELSPFSFTINQFQTNITALLTSLTLTESMMEGSRIFISSSYSLVIEKACNGMIPYLFFVASIVAFPSTLAHKVKWLIMGYLFITMMNVFRIWFVTQFVMLSQENFSLAHDFLGNVLLILTGLVLFISFIKTRHTEKVFISKETQLLPATL